MCGIFGAVGKYNIDKLRLLAVLNESRGKDSTGIYNGEQITKSTDKSSIFVGKATDDKWSGPFLIGHTRFSTKGSISEENAHPFHIKNIVGVHNGCLWNFEDKKKEYKVNYAVDSQLILHLLDEAPSKLKKLSGTWALAWHDLRFPKYIFLSNHNGTLHYLVSSDVIYFSSEKEALEALCVKGEIKEVKSNTIVKIHIKNLTCREIEVDYGGWWNGWTKGDKRCELCGKETFTRTWDDGLWVCPSCSNKQVHHLY